MCFRKKCCFSLFAVKIWPMNASVICSDRCICIDCIGLDPDLQFQQKYIQCCLLNKSRIHRSILYANKQVSTDPPLLSRNSLNLACIAVIRLFVLGFTSLLNMWSNIATVPACSSGTLTGMPCHRHRTWHVPPRHSIGIQTKSRPDVERHTGIHNYRSGIPPPTIHTHHGSERSTSWWW